jgi:beta-lactamase superfamily II metal-dependent hydrolase
MYRQGLGDCFLVSLPVPAGGLFHILIDCGVHSGTSDEAAAMNNVARDIEATTRGRLDLVVATHDHWDNLSGFVQARPVFDRITIGEVWMPWTEDPSDTVAESLRQNRSLALRGLRVMAGRLAEVDSAAAAGAARLQVPLGFFGLTAGSGPSAALDYLREHPSRPRVRYQRPGGNVVKIPGTDAFRVYILGPPRAPAFVGESDASQPDRALAGFTPSLALFAASGGLPVEADELAELSQAFDARYRLAPEHAERMAFFRDQYLAADAAWRRADSDWMSAAEPLALALDSRTNDYSLALAIELEPRGRVLLFPGDAQSGQWRTWSQLRWPIENAAVAPVTTADLLSRTVLLKVGHHGAATAGPADGFSLLTSPDLVAMISLGAEICERFGWTLPSPALLERLLRATRGRVLRSDRDFPECPDGVTTAEWTAFRESVEIDRESLYTEYHISD